MFLGRGGLSSNVAGDHHKLWILYHNLTHVCIGNKIFHCCVQLVHDNLHPYSCRILSNTKGRSCRCTKCCGHLNNASLMSVFSGIIDHRLDKRGSSFHVLGLLLAFCISYFYAPLRNVVRWTSCCPYGHIQDTCIHLRHSCEFPCHDWADLLNWRNSSHRTGSDTELAVLNETSSHLKNMGFIGEKNVHWFFC